MFLFGCMYMVYPTYVHTHKFEAALILLSYSQ